MVSADDPLTAIIGPTERVLQDYPIRTAVLFGSRVQGTATAESDVDLAVEFEPDLSIEERHRARIELVVDLMDALGLHDVDVADLSTMRPAVAAAALRTGHVIEGDDDRLERLRDRFERQTPRRSHEARMRAFEELLSRLEETV